MKNLKTKFKAFTLKLEVCAHILFNSKNERILQYLDNRLNLNDKECYYKSDEYLLHTLQKKDKEFKC